MNKTMIFIFCVCFGHNSSSAMMPQNLQLKQHKNHSSTCLLHQPLQRPASKRQDNGNYTLPPIIDRNLSPQAAIGKETFAQEAPFIDQKAFRLSDFADSEDSPDDIMFRGNPQAASLPDLRKKYNPKHVISDARSWIQQKSTATRRNPIIVRTTTPYPPEQIDDDSTTSVLPPLWHNSPVAHNKMVTTVTLPPPCLPIIFFTIQNNGIYRKSIPNQRQNILRNMHPGDNFKKTM